MDKRADRDDKPIHVRVWKPAAPDRTRCACPARGSRGVRELAYPGSMGYLDRKARRPLRQRMSFGGHCLPISTSATHIHNRLDHVSTRAHGHGQLRHE